MKEHKIPNCDNYAIMLPDTVVSYASGNRVELKSWIGPNGYRSVSMSRNSGVRKPESLHRIIGEVFIRNNTPFEISDLEINHEDGNKLNNSILNLEWVTKQENVRHGYTLDSNKNKRCIIATCIETNIDTEYYSLRECARQFNVDPKTLHERLVSYKDKPWRGHLVKYKDIV